MKNMSQKSRRSLYESIMKEVSRTVKKHLNEDEFVAPEKNFREKLIGGAKAYAKRVKEAENKYYAEHATKYLNALEKATTMQSLLEISIYMSKDGYKFPISGMVFGVRPEEAKLKDVRWNSFDQDSTYSAEELSELEEDTNFDEVSVITYYVSWKWWCANIIRCLIFWADPYGEKSNAGITEKIKEYAPKCPIIKRFPNYFKQ